MKKLCPECHALMDASEFAKHRRAHFDSRRERPKAMSRLKWPQIRAQILERDGRRCVECLKTTALEVHHRDGDWRNNDPSNLIVLCNDCHDQAHRQMKT